MKLRILAVGHKMPAWIDAGYQEYARRMPPDAGLELVEIKPEKRAAGASTARIQKLEAERILAALPAQAALVALDERGRQPTTAEFSEQLARWMREGAQPCFVIGGADGLDASVKDRSHLLLGISRLTLPHGLVRVLLAEQLYRAVTLLKGHPYHRE
ncbi:23S rRNA (pseudouridine(1915)-N(3))-methyltransferase RlmH [Betaproteobacteria bacterium SCN2]|nr:23S rRNA (pseudouridine(1915)-N(3))-methyltransferase RlmH [Betaproteobacteria bacterium SCN2]